MKATPSSLPEGRQHEIEEELCKVLVKIWGYKWVEFEDIPLPGEKDRDRIADAYSARLNAQDAVRGLLRRYIIHPRAEASKPLSPQEQPPLNKGPDNERS